MAEIYYLSHPQLFLTAENNIYKTDEVTMWLMDTNATLEKAFALVNVLLFSHFSISKVFIHN